MEHEGCRATAERRRAPANGLPLPKPDEDRTAGMTTLGEWRITPSRQPKPEDYRYDLDAALASVVSLRAHIPDDAFTAETLGTERAGSGVAIREGVVLTIGYL